MAVDKLVDSTQLNSDLTSVANAIRTKGGTSGSLSFPSGFVSAIQNIPSGGGGGTVTKSDVNFYDYDGTLVASKTKTEINAMTSDSDLPQNPSHTGLTAQGWNWTVAQLKAQLTAMPDQPVDVGQMYVTTSGKTEIDVEMHEGRLEPVLTIAVKGEISVDWGDNTTPDSMTGSSLTLRKAVGPHTYSAPGSYTIKITSVSGTFSFYCSSSYTLLRKGASSTVNRVYSNCIKAVRLGNGITSIAGNALGYCYSLSSITIPSSVTSIGISAFGYCYSLSSIAIPSGVTDIGISAFDSCYSLSSIAIPSSVTSIGNTAFSNCYGMGEYHFLSATPPTLGTTVFGSIPSDCVIYVPSASVDTYKGASNWSSYASYIQGE